MLKLPLLLLSMQTKSQPPSGGCVLKHSLIGACFRYQDQPPSGGCVLKPPYIQELTELRHQPPSGGCVLKHEKGKQLGDKETSRLQAAVC